MLKLKHVKLRWKRSSGKYAKVGRWTVDDRDSCQAYEYSADALKKKQLGTLLGMAEGMSIFLPAGAAIKAGQLHIGAGVPRQQRQ